MRYILTLALCIFCTQAQAQEYTNEQIANAIYKAEGGAKTAYPYGIKSLKYENRDNKALSRHDWARWICLNTIRNHRARHKAHNCGKDFITCLGLRYCPPKEHEINQYWVNNVKWFLECSEK